MPATPLRTHMRRNDRAHAVLVPIGASSVRACAASALHDAAVSARASGEWRTTLGIRPRKGERQTLSKERARTFCVAANGAVGACQSFAVGFGRRLGFRADRSAFVVDINLQV